MKNNTLKRISACTVVLLVLISCLAFQAFADVSGEGASVHGSYKHPNSGIIEDSGGESSEALGQSMVESMVDPQGYWETDSQNNSYLSVRLNLMSNVSKVDFAVQAAGESEWTAASWQSTAKGEDTEDFRVSMPGKDAVIRAKCFVDAMGREVVFFVTADQFEAGNPGGFAELKEGKAPAAAQKDGSAIPQNTVGLVTGGSNNVQQNKVSGQETADKSYQEVEITSSVWVMFFVLVFCAQLLACLAFWGIKTLVERALKKKTPAPLPESEEPEEEDFDMEALGNDWEEEV